MRSPRSPTVFGSSSVAPASSRALQSPLSASFHDRSDRIQEERSDTPTSMCSSVGGGGGGGRLKRSGTYDLLDQVGDEEDMKQSDI